MSARVLVFLGFFCAGMGGLGAMSARVLVFLVKRRWGMLASTTMTFGVPVAVLECPCNRISVLGDARASIS